jgi:IQ and AAA domain-containing protein
LFVRYWPAAFSKPRDPLRDPAVVEAKNLMRRKRIQLEYMREYDDAVVELKQKVG